MKKPHNNTNVRPEAGIPATFDPEGPPLMLTLHPTEQAVLAEPEHYAAITLPSIRVQGSPPMPDGSHLLQITVQLPPYLLAHVSRLLDANGVPANMLDGLIGMPPAVRMVLDVRKLSDRAKGELQQGVLAQLEALAQQSAQG